MLDKELVFVIFGAKASVLFGIDEQCGGYACCKSGNE